MKGIQKRLGSLLMAAVMLLSLAVTPAMAADTQNPPTEVTNCEAGGIWTTVLALGFSDTAWMNAINAVKVNDVPYNKEKIDSVSSTTGIWEAGKYPFNGGAQGELPALKFALNSGTTFPVTIVLSAKGYKDLTVKVTQADKWGDTYTAEAVVNSDSGNGGSGSTETPDTPENGTIAISDVTIAKDNWNSNWVVSFSNADGYNYWFGPDVDLQRRGSSVSRMFNETIQPGDLLHCDIGINGQYVHLHTDMQWVAYILREGETEAPQELQALLDTGNRFRQIVMNSMVIGKDGNAVFDEAMRLAKLEGIQPMLYTHPVGTFGHGAGPAIGMYTNQGFVAGTGERVIDEDTCFALELNVYDNLACWDGQRVFMYLEEDICRAAECDYIDGHQTKLMLL